MSAADRAVALAREAELLCIVGPTASGKTDLAAEVCAAVGGEVISADSVQVYRGFDVGSGKPTAAERRATPHHLVDTHEPDDAIDATTFADLADAAIADVRARGKTPIVVGGTFFWVRALVLGLAPAPSGDPDVRARHKAVADERGREALHAELARVDPESARRLHPNDLVRVSRALEVYELSGRTLSSLQRGHGFKHKRMDARLVALAREPDVLTERIARRVDVWLAGGWLDEVRALIDAGHEGARAMGSVGYAEVLAHLRGDLPKDELRDAIVRTTRIFARKQRTWLNHADVEWLE